jgi:hypothetical protein
MPCLGTSVRVGVPLNPKISQLFKILMHFCIFYPPKYTSFDVHAPHIHKYCRVGPYISPHAFTAVASSNEISWMITVAYIPRNAKSRINDAARARVNSKMKCVGLPLPQSLHLLLCSNLLKCIVYCRHNWTEFSWAWRSLNFIRFKYPKNLSILTATLRNWSSSVVDA